MASVVAIGNPVYDSITTPYVSTSGRVLSGCSTNVCLTLARLGHAASLVGAIGSDYAGRLAAEAVQYGISTYLQQSAQTGGFSLIYDAQGDRTLDVLGVADTITALPAICTEADAIILGPILQETPAALIAELHASSSGPLLLDPQGLMRRIGASGRIEHYRNQEIERIAPLCRVIKANELETHIITGVDPRANGAEAARRLKALGCAIAIVTLAEVGSLIDDGQRLYQIPAYQTLARDPTGAGDTYMAGFLDAYLRDPSDLYAAGCAGAACASIWIEHTGPDAPISRAESARRTRILIEGKQEG